MLGLWKNGNQREKIIKTQPSWRSVNQIKRLRIMMTVVAVVILLSVAAGLFLVWYQLHPVLGFEKDSSSQTYSEPLEPQDESTAPDVLILVNNDSPLPSEFSVDLTELDGVQVDKRLAESLEQMRRAAKSDGVTLSLTKGYVSSEQQQEQYQQKVQELVRAGYTQVRAEDAAATIVERGGRSEYQTGLAVDFSLTGSGQNSPEYQWLSVNGADYGFVLRYPPKKKSVTQKEEEPRHFRYVGKDNAQRMRQLGFCLEEYSAYLSKQLKK